MATVFALILLPLIIAVLGILLTVGVGGGAGPVLAAITFVGLGAGMFTGLYRMMHQWEDQPAE